METYTCNLCGFESDKTEDFETDLHALVEAEDMTCESCYDRMDADD